MSDLSSRPDGILRIMTAPLALPAGMRDLLPPRAAARRTLGRTALGHFERYGYQLVVPPAFEREEVIVRGLGTRTQRDLVRFLEPDTGEVIALRPDVTPQIARIAATRFRDVQGPLRLMYEGAVMRRPRGRTRRHRQVWQAGIECIGWGNVAADVEVIRAATGALSTLGLPQWRVELGHAAIAEALLREVPAAIHDLVTDALAARDTAMLSRLLGGAFRADTPIARAIELVGDAEVLDRAGHALPGSSFSAALANLREVFEGLVRAGLGDRVLFDLAEVRGFGYYTGVAFQLLAEGPGEPLGTGGRYDTLLERYGRANPATGCTLDLEHIEWALGHAGVRIPAPWQRVLLGGEMALRTAMAEQLRAKGLSVAECSSTSPLEMLGFARGAEYDAVLLCTASGLKTVDATSGELVAPPPPDAEQ